ncbi:glycoside hydrolase family 31 protein [Saccharopolyspora sp. TS4A08]|uniref:Glycoside hydrolase family 31 protein n=1 Tax=Saccharopolyspora ipomoeae TaxID=3042027 RepID=A0ABT6PWX7_9PSEU|nr:TIM-barrel domain-containing protein [Saccharopolyspora sp. TS4A08]MDI2032502.1 glycoside hydrolase family 31 protein [Saccharopolyspora sp. TS4A08]
MRVTSRVERVERAGDRVHVHTDGVEIRLVVPSDGVLRIRAGFDGDFAEESYTLTTTAWPDRLDEFMADERTRVTALPLDVEDLGELVRVTGGGLRVDIDKDPFRIRVHDDEGALLHSDVVGLGYREDSNGRRIHSSEISRDDAFYGFGETTGPLNKAQKLITMSPKDALGYDARETDPLYKHIPFYLKMNRTSRKAVGYFYHNTYDCDLDLGRERSNYWPPHSRYRADGGDIDLFLIAGPAIRDVVRRYTALTGRPPLLPKYALGYLASSMYYSELDADSDRAITDFIDIARAEDIPVDGFQLSSGYTTQPTEAGPKRCVFTWNERRFPSPEGFFASMAERGITVSPNVKPGVLDVHPRLDEFAEADVFVTRSADAVATAGAGPAAGAWWGGPGRFVDFTKPDARAAWQRWLTEAVLDKGTTSVWNDNCEYDGIIDTDSGVDFDGAGATVARLRNVMSNLMCRVTRDGIAATNPSARPYIVCRSGHAGIQRYAQSWAGDNSTSWESLRHNIATILGMGLSGFPHHGCDIGGFHGPAPEPELLVRWVQHGIFQPRFSIHSVNSDNTVTEPWMYPDHTHHVRDAIKLRYRLFPYLYSLAARASATGWPIMEALVSAFQDDPGVDESAEEFMLGDALLVATVLTPGARTRSVRLPAGEVFYDAWTRQRHQGGQVVELPVDLGSIPLFLRGGGIVPVAENQLRSLTRDEVTDLRLICVPDRDARFTLYEDDGLTRAHEDGAFRETEIRMTAGEQVRLELTRRGEHRSTVRRLLFDVVRPGQCPHRVDLDGRRLPQFLHRARFDEAEAGWYYDIALGSALVKTPDHGGDLVATISFEPVDMIGM